MICKGRCYRIFGSAMFFFTVWEGFVDVCCSVSLRVGSIRRMLNSCGD